MTPWQSKVQSGLSVIPRDTDVRALPIGVSRKSVAGAYGEGQESVIVDTNALLSLRSPALAVYASGVETRDGVKTRGSAGM